MENRNGLAVAGKVTQADGTARTADAAEAWLKTQGPTTRTPHHGRRGQGL